MKTKQILVIERVQCSVHSVREHNRRNKSVSLNERNRWIPSILLVLLCVLIWHRTWPRGNNINQVKQTRLGQRPSQERDEGHRNKYSLASSFIDGRIKVQSFSSQPSHYIISPASLHDKNIIASSYPLLGIYLPVIFYLWFNLLWTFAYE